MSGPPPTVPAGAGAGSTAAWRWHHAGYAVDDLDAAIAFHRAAFGFEVVFEVRGLDDLIAQVTGVPGLTVDLAQLADPNGATVLELLCFHDVPDDVDPALPVRPGMAHAAFSVEDLDAAVAAVAAEGGALLGEITTFAEGRGVYCRTGVGTVVELLEQLRPATGRQGA